jgi:hypothetical protein
MKYNKIIHSIFKLFLHNSYMYDNYFHDAIQFASFLDYMLYTVHIFQYC